MKNLGKVVVTGGAGFIGSHVVHQILSRGLTDQVTVLDDLSNGQLSKLDSYDIEFVHGSILNRETALDTLKGASTLVHLAALGSVPRSIENPTESFRSNALGTFTILEAARLSNCRNVIFSSSSSVFGGNTASPKSELDWTQPLSPYAAGKLAAEGILSSYAAAYGMNTTVYRFFNVFGPGQRMDSPYAAVIPRIANSLRDGSTFKIFGDGTQTRDFTFVEDVVRVIIDSIVRPNDGFQLLNLAFGKPISVNDLLSMTTTIIGRQFPTEFSASRPGEILNSCNDPSELKRRFPSIVETRIETALELTFRSYGVI